MPVDCDLAEVSGLLSKNFSEELHAVLVDHAPDGGHRGEHFVADVGTARRFGLKAAAAGGERTELAGAIAHLLHAPNAARCSLDKSCKLSRPEQLAGRTVLKTEWLSGDTSSFSSADVRTDALLHATSFYRQFGGWTAIAIFLGISDRDNPGNWVWDKRSHRLQMIDFESAFGECQPAEVTRFLTRTDIGLADRAAWRKSPTDYPPGFRDGFVGMRYRMRTHFRIIKPIVEERGLAQLIPILQTRLAVPDSEALDQVTITVVGPPA